MFGPRLRRGLGVALLGTAAWLLSVLALEAGPWPPARRSRACWLFSLGGTASPPGGVRRQPSRWLLSRSWVPSLHGETVPVYPPASNIAADLPGVPFN